VPNFPSSLKNPLTRIAVRHLTITKLRSEFARISRSRRVRSCASANGRSGQQIHWTQVSSASVWPAPAAQLQLGQRPRLLFWTVHEVELVTSVREFQYGPAWLTTMFVNQRPLDG